MACVVLPKAIHLIYQAQNEMRFIETRYTDSQPLEKQLSEFGIAYQKTDQGFWNNGFWFNSTEEQFNYLITNFKTTFTL